MDNKERYEMLKNRQQSLTQEIARRDGERKVYIDKLKALGFKSKAEAEAYLKEKREEYARLDEEISKKLDAYESLLKEAESKLGV